MEQKENSYKALIILSVAAFFWPLLQDYGELSLLDFTYANIIFALIIFFQISVLLIIQLLTFVIEKYGLIKQRYSLLETVKYLLTSIFISLNIYYFLFTLISIHRNIETIIAIILIPFFYYLLKSPARIKPVYIFSIIFLALSFFQFGFSYLTGSTLIKPHESNWDLSRYKPLESLKDNKNKRNIYLISFDAVASPESLRTFYGIESAEHIEYLRSTGFKVMDSAFSGGFNTRLSFFNMMNLGEKTKLIPAFFSTKSLNPSYILLDKAGYKTQFLFRGNYMGSNSETLDYFYPEKSFINLCDFIDQQYGYIACNPGITRGIIEKYFSPVPSIEDFFEIIIQRIVLINSNKESWITFAHIWFPGHAPHDFQHSNEEAKNLFINKTIMAYPKLTQMMQNVVKTILASDNNPIIIIYSDHGAWLTNGLNYNQENSYYSKEQIYLEKNGVLFSVYPHDFCISKFNNGYKTINLIPDLLECEKNR